MASDSFEITTMSIYRRAPKRFDVQVRLGNSVKDSSRFGYGTGPLADSIEGTTMTAD
jgi:hypothetical protein